MAQVGLEAPSPMRSADGFDWASAVMGAGAAAALVALRGVALITMRRRTEHAGVSPTPSAS